METSVDLLLMVLLVGWTVTRTSEAAVSPSWRPLLPAQIPTSIGRRAPSAPFRFSLQEDEYPVHHQSQLISHDVARDQCALYKVLFTQQLYFEYIHYKTNLPDLKEFTLCMWKKFTNHSNDHPLFSYAVGDQPRSILSWIANTQRSSYYMLSVDGHTLYRLNYPLRLNRWYHSCQSWNGRTGEWQIWVNDERVGRGFHNRLVGHVIKGGGIAISGQEQRQLGGGFLEGEGAPPGSGGFLGELTMLQLYGVALTAGKAHRDHKHHHAHHFEHNTNNNVPLSTTTTQAPITGLPLPMSPFLTGGQLNHQVKINQGAHIQIVQNGVTLRHPSLPVPQASPQPLPPAILPPQPTPDPNVNSLPPSIPFDFTKTLVGFGNIGSSRPISTRFLTSPSLSSSSPVNGFSFIDRRYRNVPTGTVDSLDTEDGNKQEGDDDGSEEVQRMVNHIELKKITKRENADATKTEHGVEEKEEKGDDKSAREATMAGGSRLRRDSSSNATSASDQRKQKRGLVYAEGSIIDDSYIHQIPQQLLTDSTGSYFNGLTSFGLSSIPRPKPKDKEDEREPAEEEVRRVMNVCDGCADEPFEKAIVMAWRTVPKKLYSGALHVPATQACKAF